MNVTALFEEYVNEYLASGSRNRRLLQYVLVGALGLGINQGVLFLATGVLGLSYVIGGTISRVVSVLANYGINDAWTWNGRGDAGAGEYVVRGVKYVLTRIVGIGIGLASLVLFVELLGLHYLIANVLAVGVGIVWGFGASERWVWRSDDMELTRFERAVVRTRDRIDRRLEPHGLDSRSLTHRVERFDIDTGAVRRRVRGLWTRPSSLGGDDSASATAVDGGQVQRHLPILDGHRLRERIADVDRATLAVFALAGLMFVAFTIYTSLLYRGYQLTGADYGSYLHMFWTTVNGHGFLQQGKFRVGHPSQVYWGGHFTLTLLAFLPFFAIWQSPYALLVMKSFALAASVPLLWFVARQHIESRRLAGLVVFSYAFNPFLWSAWAFDFQEQSLLPLLLLSGYLLYVKGRRVGFLVLLTLAMLTNEFVIPLSFGFLIGLAASKLLRGEFSVSDRTTILAGFGLVVVSHLVAGFVVAQFSTVSGVPVGVLSGPFQPLVEGHRVSLGQLVPIALLNPDATFQALTINLRGKIIYLVFFSLPVLFVAYADEVTLGSLAPFVGFAWLVSNRAAYVEFRAHYPLYLLPFVYIGAVRAIGRWGHLVPRMSTSAIPTPELSWRLAAKVGLAILLVNASAFVVIGGGNMKPIQPKTTHHDVIDQGLGSIPDDASVVTQNDLFPHIARHPEAGFVVAEGPFKTYEREFGPVTPDYIVYDTTLNPHWTNLVISVFEDRLGSEYGLYEYEDGFWKFKRGFEGTPTAVTSDQPLTLISESEQFNAGEFIAMGDVVRQNDHIISTDGAAEQRIWYGPYALMAPGTYTATFEVYATESGDRPAATVDVAVGENHRVIASEQVASEPGWQEVTVQFTLNRPTSKVEFRGAHATAGSSVAFDGVTVERQSSSGTNDLAVDASATPDAAAITTDGSLDAAAAPAPPAFAADAPAPTIRMHVPVSHATYRSRTTTTSTLEAASDTESVQS